MHVHGQHLVLLGSILCNVVRVFCACIPQEPLIAVTFQCFYHVYGVSNTVITGLYFSNQTLYHFANLRLQVQGLCQSEQARAFSKVCCSGTLGQD